MTDYDVTQYTCNDGNIAKILIPNNVTEDDLRGLYELLQVVAVRRFGLDLSERDAVQGEWIVREYCTNELDYRRWIEIECPFCGERPTYENLDNMNFCPNCGAKMTKGGDDK